MDLQKTIFIVFLFSTITGRAQFPVSDIPDSLLTGADAVIRMHNVDFRYESENSGVMKCVFAVTVLNDKAKDVGSFACYTDDFREIKRFAGTVYDRAGKVIRKIKKGDIFSTQFSSHLASDDWSHYYECRMGIYPYTVCYEYEIRYKNGMIGFPVFVPLYSWHTALQEGKYSLDFPENTEVRYKALHITEAPECRIQDGRKVLEWKIKGMEALKPEPFGLPLSERVPRIYSGPEEFVYAGTRGSMCDWQLFGKWQNGLLKGRDVLPESLKRKLAELTDGLDSEREKVKAVYDYLAETTRYVSIQLGIGGLQPIAASRVSETSFGDCKGLSNLMKSMLKAIHIPSDYVVISTENRRLFRDFANPVQMNHVILRVPLPEDTLWLECTNPALPFGYIHDNIAGHDAIAITDEGGVFCTLPDYPDSLNREVHRVEIDLKADGSATADVCRTAWLSQYEKLSALQRVTPKERLNYLSSRVRLPRATLSSVTIEEIKNDFPCAVLNYRIAAEKYGSSSGKRHFLPANVFRPSFSGFKETERKSPIINNYGYVDCDTIVFRLPEGYVIESLPPAVLSETEFGRFSSQAAYDDGKVTIIQQLYFPRGSYPPEKQALFFAFLKQISDAYQSKLVIREK